MVAAEPERRNPTARETSLALSSSQPLHLEILRPFGAYYSPTNARKSSTKSAATGA